MNEDKVDEFCLVCEHWVNQKGCQSPEMLCPEEIEIFRRYADKTRRMKKRAKRETAVKVNELFGVQK
jgi:hypothetical protein